MKKFLALILTLCLMLTTMSAFAENVETGESSMDLSGLMSMFGGSETGESSMDLSGLMSMFGGSETGESGVDLSGLMSMFGGSETGESSMDLSGLMSMFGNSEGGESSMDLSSLLAMFGNSEGGTGSSSFDLSTLLSSLGFTAATAVTTVAAKSEEQFFGTWTLSRFIVKGYEASMDLFTKFGLKTSIEMTVAADKLTFAAGEKTTEIEVTEPKFADGELTFTVKGEALKLALSETGELVLTMPSMESTTFAVFFTK